MNINKDILLAIGIVGLGGVMLYQVLFNFLLPIALFVVLLYILKLLIKGFDTSEEKETTELLRDKSNSSTDKDLEEINPNKKENIEENKSVEIKPVIEIKPVQKEEKEKEGKEE